MAWSVWVLTFFVVMFNIFIGSSMMQLKDDVTGIRKALQLDKQLKGHAPPPSMMMPKPKVRTKVTKKKADEVKVDDDDDDDDDEFNG